MTEESFYNECFLNCLKNQIEGYQFGDPKRIGFRPFVPVFKNQDGTYNRERMIEGPAYTFTFEQRQELLKRD